MRIFDCVLYNGEIEVLLLRLHELHEYVDIFVIVEATKTFSGLPKNLHLRAQWDQVRPFARKIRYVVITDDIEGGSPWDRERFQRNSIERGLLDAIETDLICASDVDEIPKADVIRQLRNVPPKFVGFRLLFSYFFLNYRNIVGPEANLTWCCAFPRKALESHTPDQLRYGIRDGSIAAEQIDNAGWHFSYLADLKGIKRKIAAFSHQEFNTPAFLDSIDIRDVVRHRRDFFLRTGFVWDVVGINDLPAHVLSNPRRYRHLIAKQDGSAARPANSRSGWRRVVDRWQRRHEASLTHSQRPVIICPYVYDNDREQVIRAFGLDQQSGRHLPFFFWKDEKLIGPERAFEQCWNQFPGRDVIIVHTDMRPMPQDQSNDWYAALCAQAEQLPDAGLIGCDLLYPLQSPKGRWYVQCAGGYFKGGKIGHIGGGVRLDDGVATPEAYEYDDRFSTVRSSQWVTFGGVYIRRETIDMVGAFDLRYQWAYVMDVDYCLEAHLRGQRIYQVPINLLHEESKTSKKFLVHQEYRARQEGNATAFYQKWAWYLEPSE
jgi:hypothetical protein